MRIKISTASPDVLVGEALVLGFFSDERPPKGFCGFVDWRLNGMISAEIAAGRLSGAYLEKAACIFPERIPISRFLLFGLGGLYDLTYDKLYNAGYEMGRTVTGIGATELALPIPAAGRGHLQLPGITEALMTGLFDAWAHEPGRCPVTSLEIPAAADQTGDIRLGLDRSKQHVETADIEIWDPGEPIVAGDMDAAVPCT
ncbi:MAG: hypothetical protein M0009_02375 [Deltaproteobacteria bacterium]|nr:hypothetical protein [Deltaproteobacteria bacterium]